MEIQQFQPQLLTTSHLIQKSRTALLQPFFFGMSQIYQITVVWKNITCLQSIFPAILLKQGNTFLRQGLRHPLTLILGKQGKSIRSYSMGIDGSQLHTAAGRYMCTYKFHISIIIR